MAHFPTACSRVALAVALLAAVGCSSLTPQIFSDRLLASQDANGQWVTAGKGRPATLEDTIADVSQVRGRYLAAVASEGNAGPLLNAGLIGLSAVTLFKGITGANTRDVAGAGVLGSTAWAAHSTLTSAPRRDVYRAGAQALGCALAAAEPLRVIEARLGKADDAASADTLHGRYKALLGAQSTLRQRVIQHAALTEPTQRLTREARPAREDRLRVLPTCKAPAADASAEERLAYTVCLRRPPTLRTVLVAAEPAQFETREAPPELVRAHAQARARVAASLPHQQQALRAIEGASGAAQALWHQAVQVQLAVSREVEKTVPQPASVFAAVKGMREVGFTLAGAAALAPRETAGAAHAGGNDKDRAATRQWRALDDADRQALQQLRQATEAVALAQEALDAMAQSLSASNPAQARAELAECRLSASAGLALLVTPPGPQVAVAVGGTQAFFVAGGTGVPSATVIDGASPGPLPLKIEGGQFRFDFTLPAEAVVGSRINLRFADGAGEAERLMEVQVGAAAASASTPAAAVPVAPACPARVKHADLAPRDARLLGPGCLSDADVDAAIRACNATATVAELKTETNPSKIATALVDKPAACKPF